MPCNLFNELPTWLDRNLPAIDWARWWASSGTAFALVAAAEFGDKSQLVCMTLAARHRHWPILFGAVLAFAVLNLVAVSFGAAAARWLPESLVSLTVAVLFAVFGVKALLFKEEEDEAVKEKSGHGIFLTTFLMIFFAEFGDKTQLAVAGLGAAAPPVPVWFGATLALGATSAVGIWAGAILLRRISQRALHIASGLLFLGFAAFAASRILPQELAGWLQNGFDRLISTVRALFS
ncbi:TMEM165/GDT1 family protein [Methylocaldum sp.]|uniref:TMEM165/GDT1 family protein n=1 Tax=Methylocaldum sp. TaxID=1969727 RepID=UPI002D2E099E|nr:TMEM165/GDT1 family protein [Methylocaldum sp.]HYE35210.1 TMEM165/GDT1 family protein [Methylocaldum sp.]